MNQTEKHLCPQCRHQNLSDAICCSLCDWALAEVGVNITIAPGADSIVTIAPTADHAATIEQSDGSAYEQNDHLAQFKISEILGQGGMGAVYRAKDLKLERFVALKMFRTQADTAQNGGQQLLDEARMACKLNHPNIVTIYDIARGQDSNFIVMEWVDGQPLDRLIPARGLPVEKALEYACQIADGISCAHRNGIIHRDIKPQNIMLTKGGRIKILDFGIAGLLRQQGEKASGSADTLETGDHSDLTRLSGITGTPYYMAPEQAQGLPLDQRADIFSFGTVLYQMLAGQQPFKGRNAEQLIKAITSGNYIPLKQHLPELAQPIVALIDKMLAVNKNERWQTSAQLATELHTIYQQMSERKNWWQRRHWISKLAIVAPLMLVLGWSVREIVFPPSTQELIERQLSEVTKVAVLPFENISGDPMLKVFSAGLSSAINNDLISISESRRDLWVVPYSEVNKIDDISAEKIHKLFGVGFAISGSLENLGSQHRLTISIVDTKQVRVLKRKTLLIDEGQLFSEQSRILDQIIGLLGWNVDLTKAVAENRTPPIGAAYKHYLNGLGFLYRHGGSKNVQSAIDEFEQSILIDKTLYQAYFALSEAYIEKHRESTVVEDLQQAKKYANAGFSISPESLVSHNTLGQLSLLMGNYSDATEQFKSVLTKFPQNYNALIGLAHTELKLAHFQSAEKLYLEALKTDPNNWWGHRFLGYYYWRIGNYRKAEFYYRKLVTLTPQNPMGYLNLSGTLYMQEKNDEAMEILKQAIGKAPDAQIYSNIGTIEFYEQNYNEAVEAFNHAVRLQPSNYLLWANLGDALYWHQQGSGKHGAPYAKAIALLEDTLALKSDYDLSAFLALILAKNGELNKSRSILKNLPSAQLPDQHYERAFVYELLSERTKALTEIQLALEGNYSLDEITNEPFLAELAQDQRFIAMVEQLKHP